MKNKAQSDIAIILLFGIVSLVAGVGVVASHISKQLREQFEFETGMYMCMEMAQEYYAPCHLEQDEDGKYNWYFNPQEGRK